MKQIFPSYMWLSGYDKSTLLSDFTAAVVVTVLLIPQSLAYALLAGVPVEVGLYASIFPLILYACFGTSRTLSVGPVAVLSLMTASTLGSLVEQGLTDYVNGAITLALLSGLFLSLMGVLRLGFLANFLSHSVISGFISASGILIALSQLKHIFGVRAHGDTLFELVPSIWSQIPTANLATMVLGFTTLIFLFSVKRYAKNFFLKINLNKKLASSLAKAAPILGVVVGVALVALFNLDQQGVAVTGEIPTGLPRFSLSLPTVELIKALWFPALLLSVIGYVESISVGKTLAGKRGQKIDPNQELLGLGAANIASAISGGMPVTGGFSRTVVNFEAGAVTQLSSIMAAVGIALAAMFLTPLLYFLPKALLAATIIVAVMGLLDFSIIKHTWRFDKRDFYAVLATILLTLAFGVEVGVACGVALSLVLFLYRTASPHIAEVGLIDGSEHFRNVKRFHTTHAPQILSVRPDESLFFANASALENYIQQKVFEHDEISHVVLMCSAVNDIDFSALEMLEMMNRQLSAQGISLHLSEVKGPVMDKLKRSGFLHHLSGEVFISQFQAYSHVSGLINK